MISLLGSQRNPDIDDSFAGGASSLHPEGEQSIWNFIWRAKVPLKIRITAWKAMSGALATEQNKLFRHLGTTDRCRVCGRESKGSFHALVACSQVRLVWQSMRGIWPLHGDDVLVDNGKEWILHVLATCDNKTRDMVILLVWRIQLRNDVVHGKEVPPVEVTMDFLDSYYKSLDLARNHSMEEIIKGKMLIWEKVVCPMVHQTGPTTPWPHPWQTGLPCLLMALTRLRMAVRVLV